MYEIAALQFTRSSHVTRVVENLPANAGDIRDKGSIPAWGRSPHGGHSNPLQYLCLENWWTEEPAQSVGSQRLGHN